VTIHGGGRGLLPQVRLGVNPFSDLTNEMFRRRNTHASPPPAPARPRGGRRRSLFTPCQLNDVDVSPRTCLCAATGRRT